MKNKSFLIFSLFTVFFVLPFYESAHAETVYIGVPHTRISINDYGQTESTKLTEKEANKFKVILAAKNDVLTWKSRKSSRLCGDLRGAYYTFFSENGSGHIRLMPDDIREGLDELANNGKKISGYTEVIYNSQGLIIYQGFAVHENLDAVPALMACKAYNPLDKFRN